MEWIEKGKEQKERMATKEGDWVGINICLGKKREKGNGSGG